MPSPRHYKQQDLFGFLKSTTSSEMPASSSSPSKTRSRRAPAKRKRSTAASRAPHRDPADEEDEEKGNTSSDVEVIHFEPRKIPTPGSDEEDQSPRRPKAKRGKGAINTPFHSPPPTAGDVISIDSDSDEPIVTPARLKGKSVARRKRVSDSGSEEEARPKRRKLTKGVRPPTPDDSDEVDEDAIVETRMRARDKKTAFQKNLEKLKRRKLGKTEVQSTEEEEEEEDSFEDDTPFRGARPGGLSDEDAEGGHDSQEEDDFIVEDDGDVVPDLPSAFSMSTHQDLTHHFKIVCQLFVHMAVLRANQRRKFMEQTMKDNEYFSVPLQVARRKLSGIRDSLASSVWRSDFKNSLGAHPTLTMTKLSLAVPQCDACHLGGRLSTIVGRVSGAPYDKLSFEPDNEVSDEENESQDDSDEDEPKKGRIKKEFNLGRFCARRTQIFHRLCHWEYNLYQALLEEVEHLRNPESGQNFVRVAYAHGLQPPEDLSDADGIMGWLDERGLITFEWQKVRQLMDDATDLESRAGKREDDVDLDFS
ncbi:hypothetical protein BV25DRAFT_1850622 [Artomyces pyxidatus]|uniref:Uncharacterized protein n=1 Tax=Artomyces pyxidatus TaxID=48021 RepID=A0ACB8TAZ9_9AGAM|nr:hypothetical protein BV25DRAFT_1850622 [Artomyces pyxidatus]